MKMCLIKDEIHERQVLSAVYKSTRGWDKKRKHIFIIAHPQKSKKNYLRHSAFMAVTTSVALFMTCYTLNPKDTMQRDERSWHTEEVKFIYTH